MGTSGCRTMQPKSIVPEAGTTPLSGAVAVASQRSDDFRFCDLGKGLVDLVLGLVARAEQGDDRLQRRAAGLGAGQLGDHDAAGVVVIQLGPDPGLDPGGNRGGGSRRAPRPGRLTAPPGAPRAGPPGCSGPSAPAPALAVGHRGTERRLGAGQLAEAGHVPCLPETGISLNLISCPPAGSDGHGWRPTARPCRHRTGPMDWARTLAPVVTSASPAGPGRDSEQIERTAGGEPGRIAAGAARGRSAQASPPRPGPPPRHRRCPRRTEPARPRRPARVPAPAARPKTALLRSAHSRAVSAGATRRVTTRIVPTALTAQATVRRRWP